MDTEIDKRISAKVFIGCRFHAELKMLLTQSKEWKQAVISHEDTLCEVHYQQKDFIGMFIPEAKTTLHELRQYEELILKKLYAYCPTLEIDTLKLSIFPQIFIN